MENKKKNTEKEITVIAHVPTQQYGFIEFHGTADDLHRIEILYNNYAEKKLTFKKGVFIEMQTFTGETVRYNEDTHEYTDLEMNPLLSGSQYANKFRKPFNKEVISAVVGKKYGVDKDVITAMWDANSIISSTFGTALHLAMEQWFLHNKVGTEKNYHLPKPEYLRTAVETYPMKDADCIPEAMVSDVKNKMVGQVDLIHVIDRENKIAYIRDFKSDSDVEKNLEHHAHQLNFYRKILENFGWKIKGLFIDNYTTEWKTYEVPFEDVKIV